MRISILECMWLFLVYSFLGWIVETCFCVVKYRKFMNRGVLSGPVCIVYGTAAVIITVGFRELRDSIFLFFLGSFGVCTFIEWLTGKLLEKLFRRKLWDYSGLRWNIDGYICLRYSMVWGILSVLAAWFLTPFLVEVYHRIPVVIMQIILWGLMAVFVLDILGSSLIIHHQVIRNETLGRFDAGLSSNKVRLGNWITNAILGRMQKAYPQMSSNEKEKAKSTVFAEGCSFYKLTALFFIGAFAGDLIEMVFCRITMGYWMSRSSVVWGQFSIVWGLAMVVATSLLYNYRSRSTSFIFLVGTVLGGIYEYLCSVFTEIVFGKIFWDYSDFAFNLGGRINLLFCFFWGIASVAWLKGAYPYLSKCIEKIPMKLGKCLTWIMIVFMIADAGVSAAALIRQEQRQAGMEPISAVGVWLDENFDDDALYRIYPKAKEPPKTLDKTE